MRKSLWLIAVPSIALVLCACAAASSPSPKSGADASAPAPKAAVHAEAGESEEEENVALTAVPEAALAAARGAVPGITFKCAEREVENGATVYTLCGSANGKKYEVEVSAEGKVSEVEEGKECGDCKDGGRCEDDDEKDEKGGK